MRSIRIPVDSVLGYPLQRLDEYDDTGLLLGRRFEVLDPDSGAVLASRPNARAALNYVIVHELRTIKPKNRAGKRSVDAA